MENLLNNIFHDELHVDPSKNLVLLTEPINSFKANHEKMIQLMFETFNVPSFYAGKKPNLSLIFTGRTTGIIVELGHGDTQLAVIYEGYQPPNALFKYNFAGSNLDEYLERLINELGYMFGGREEKLDFNKIKEKYCYAALDYDEELKRT